MQSRKVWPWVIGGAVAVVLALVGAAVGVVLAVANGGPKGLVDSDPAGFRACQAVDSYLHHTASERVAQELAASEAARAKTETIRAAGPNLRALHDACADAGYEDMPAWS